MWHEICQPATKCPFIRFAIQLLQAGFGALFEKREEKMDSQKDANSSRMEELEAKKRELVSKIRQVNTELREKRQHIASLLPNIRGKGKMSGRRLVEEVEGIEFQISTTAFTPAQEKSLIKRLKKAKEELDAAMKVDGVREKLDAARVEISALDRQYLEIDGQIKAVRAELDTLYKDILSKNRQAFEQRQHAREERQRQDGERRQRNEREEGFRRMRSERDSRRSEERKEMEPFMKEVDPFVSLEEIAEIKRKPKQEAATE